MLLEQDNLKISEKKTGVIASSNAAKRILQERLPPTGPRVHDVMRDLGVDCRPFEAHSHYAQPPRQDGLDRRSTWRNGSRHLSTLDRK